MDQEDAVTGTWKFDAALPGTLPEVVEPVMALMEEEEIGLSETFNPAVSVSLENEDILVTVKDSAAVRSLCPVLEIPCQIGVRAVVTLDGVPVAAYGDADSVQFQVVQGGTYRITIRDTAALTLMQEQNDTGLSVEVRVDNWTEQTWTGTPYCAVYSAEGQLLSIGQAEAAITVSGNARGADREAQEACLAAGGTVISVVADSLEKCPLRENVLFLSEDGFNAAFTPQRALSRNRVIHCLGMLTLVAQSDLKKGGTWDGCMRNLRHAWTPICGYDDISPAMQALFDRGAQPVTIKQLSNIPALLPKQDTFFDQ